MHILLVIDGLHPRDGGPPSVVAGSALALKSLGINVTVLTTLQDGDRNAVLLAWQSLIEAKVEIQFCEPIGYRGMFPWFSDHSAIKSAIKAADVVHLHGLWNPVLIYAARIARALSKPYLFSTHGVLDHRAVHNNFFKLIKKRLATVLLNLPLLLRDSSGVIFGSEAEAEQSWEIASGISKVFIPNGVEFVNNSAPVNSQDRQLVYDVVPEFERWGRSLLYFARIHPEKGVDLLVQAFNIIAREFPEAGLLIAGLEQDKVFQKRVERLISKSSDPTRLVMTTALTGAKSHFLYRMCDCYVLPSHAEGFSVALTEALANGQPTLITRYCHMPVIEEAQAGIIVETTVEDLVTGLRKLLSMTSEELRNMGQNARRLYEENYTWPKVGVRLSTVYSDAIVRKKGLSG
jgi:glycosyltransferase involved in cell wall biosynthesis